jgi:hypothetical protein
LLAPNIARDGVKVSAGAGLNLLAFAQSPRHAVNCFVCQLVCVCKPAELKKSDHHLPQIFILLRRVLSILIQIAEKLIKSSASLR